MYVTYLIASNSVKLNRIEKPKGVRLAAKADATITTKNSPSAIQKLQIQSF